MCLDVDECTEKLDNCTTNQECKNTEGSFKCTCIPGYEMNNDSLLCVDIDECQKEKICGENAVCENEPASYKCICLLGYDSYEKGVGCKG